MSEAYERESVAEIVRKQEHDYIHGTTTHSKYVKRSMYDDLCKIDAYLNSKHTTGDKDSRGRDKPFFNITTAAVNIWYRATDIDRKNIRLKATKCSHEIPAIYANIQLQNWMRKENFGYFLNDWGRSLARYGSSLLKFVEKGDKLHCSVVPWNRLIVDPVDLEGNPVIEILELTESQLRQKEGYDKEMVEKLCDAVTARKTLDGQTKDNKADYIKLYEVHGSMPLSYITENEEDADEYVQQMHVVSFVASKEKKDAFDDFTLVKGREEKSPYMLTHLIREDGQTLAIGAVQHLFEAQWMMNHTVKSIKDQLDLASKLIFQTADGNFAGWNALKAIETGQILVHQPNMPLTQLANNSHDIGSLQSFGEMWKALSQEIVSTPDALMGNNAPSGTAWRQVEALQNEAHSLFEVMTENKGIDVETMMRERIIPFIKRTALKNTDEIAATLEQHDITRIDAKYVKNQVTKRVNRKIIDAALGDGEPIGPEEQAQLTSEAQTKVQSNLAEMGNQRFFKPSEISSKTWRDLFKDFEWEVECDVTGEASMTKEDLATLTTVFQTIASNPGILEVPKAQYVFNKILTKTGAMSPVELSAQPAPKPAPMVQAQVQAGGQQQDQQQAQLAA